MPGEWVFRNHPTSTDEARAMAGFWTAGTAGNIARAAVFYIDDVFGAGARDAFRDAFEDDGGQVVWEGSYEESGNDFPAAIAAATAAGPDALYVIGFVDATAGLIARIRDDGLALPLGANMTMGTPYFLELLGDAAEGMYLTITPFELEKDLAGTDAFDFAEEYRARYDAEPDAYAAMTYDAVGMLAACARPDARRDALRQRLAALTAYNGVLGALSMDPERNVVLPLRVAVVENGALIAAE